MMSQPFSKRIQQTLQAEGLCLFLGALYVYQHLGFSWTWFLALFLAPDLCFLGYLAGQKVGVLCYNIFHTEIGPILLAIGGLMVSHFVPIEISLIWIAHINFDRMIGCGLKYQLGGTHLGSGLFKKNR